MLHAVGNSENTIGALKMSSGWKMAVSRIFRMVMLALRVVTLRRDDPEAEDDDIDKAPWWFSESNELQYTS